MVSSLPSPIQPTKVKKILPPNVLLHIFHLLPLSALAEVALVSRRFKVLAYDDEIWDEKLDIVLQQESDSLTSPLGKLTKQLDEIMDWLTFLPYHSFTSQA